MTQPIASVARIAATPEQAKIFVALLQAEGIPASIDGDSLADEVAVSRRMLNLNGTRVMVPTSSLERAREILGAVQIDEAELAAQALTPPKRRSTKPRRDRRAPPELLKPIENLSAQNLPEDLPSINADESKKARNDEWLKDVYKDVHLYETLAIIYDMMKS